MTISFRMRPAANGHAPAARAAQDEAVAGGPPAVEGSVAACAGIAMLCLAAGAIGGWWHVIGTPEPHYILFLRLASATMAVVALAGFWSGGRRASLWLLSGAAAALLPLLLTLWIAVYDPGSMTKAVAQVKQARRLMDVVENSDRALEADWFDGRLYSPAAVLRNDYTLADGMETVLFFARGGWYLSVAGGVLLLCATWGGEAARARALLVRYRTWVLGGAGIVLAVAVVPIGVGHYYWNRARADQAAARDSAALANYQRAAFWDRRFRYDIMFHMELGKLYYALGRRSEPDCIALLADMDAAAGLNEQAYLLYRRTYQGASDEPTARMRYANTLLRAASEDFLAGRFQAAQDKYTAAGTADPTNIEVVYGTGLLQTKRGDYENAAATWKRLIADVDGIGIFRNKYISSYTFTKPLVARSWGYLGWCYYNLHDYRRAAVCDFGAHNMGARLTLLD